MSRTHRERHLAIYSVHTTKPDVGGAIEIVFEDQRSAEAFARERSRDHRVLSASVTRFFVGELGTRHPVSWFVDGIEQPRRYDRRLYPTDGSSHRPTTPAVDEQRIDPPGTGA